MSRWKIDMSQEEKRIEPGKYKASIEDVTLVTALESKSGNPYYKWKLSLDNGASITMITTLIKGKRWLLQQVLNACGIEKNEKDEYEFGEADVLNKCIVVKIINKTEKFFIGDREVEITKQSVVEVSKLEEV